MANGSMVGKVPTSLEMVGGKDAGQRQISVAATRTRPSMDADEPLARDTRGAGGNS